ncbi:hypothetical protein HanHA300_Chr01g0001291 [Helianthus annuus]|nr:hypothetical protein HanHA300_Chr01g0001291 [Helianthus annuus]KAJ0625415.1 hypothetical protein HanHA89_Chr01g0001381 [Helianthus annuus]KAJ0781835.1 hypothetical protein HanLR1_Chr01g0001301 [Helianthus annuus]
MTTLSLFVTILKIWVDFIKLIFKTYELYVYIQLNTHVTNHDDVESYGYTGHGACILLGNWDHHPYFHCICLLLFIYLSHIFHLTTAINGVSRGLLSVHSCLLDFSVFNAQ